MHVETMSQFQGCGHITLLLNEMTDISNQSELSLMAWIFKDEVVKNPYLDLPQLICCDSATIFKTVELENESINIKNTHFWGMDGYSMMSGDHNGVKQFFLGCQCHTLHTSFIETIVLLCVCVIPQYVDFKNFDALLLNLYLLMKNSSVKQEV